MFCVCLQYRPDDLMITYLRKMDEFIDKPTIFISGVPHENSNRLPSKRFRLLQKVDDLKNLL